jgi:hypothetical protein
MKAFAIVLIAIAGFTGVMILRTPVPGHVERAHGVEAPARGASVQRSNAKSTPDPDHRGELVRDIESALVSVDDRERDRALSESLPQLVAADPSAAAHILDRTPPGFSRDEARDRIARLWAQADLNGALEWVTTLDDDNDRRLATIEIRSQIAASDPATAIEISDLMDVGRNDGSLAHIAQLWAEENPSAAAAWAAKQPPSPLRDDLLARIARVCELHHAACL